MPHGKAKPKPISIEHWSLVKPADLLDLLVAMLKHGYVGAITAHVNPSPPSSGDGADEVYRFEMSPNHAAVTGQAPREDEVVWGIQLRSELQPEFSADVGQVVLWDGHELQVISAEEFAERYTA